MPKQVLAEMERRMKAALADLSTDLGTLRTGRATPALLDKIQVEYYGTQTPLSQVATITTPDPRQLVITPWDKSLAGPIANIISKSDLGLQATKDGDQNFEGVFNHCDERFDVEPRRLGEGCGAAPGFEKRDTRTDGVAPSTSWLVGGHGEPDAGPGFPHCIGHTCDGTGSGGSAGGGFRPRSRRNAGSRWRRAF